MWHSGLAITLTALAAAVLLTTPAWADGMLTSRGEAVRVSDRRIAFDSGDDLLGPSVLRTADGYRMWYTAVDHPPKDSPLIAACPWLAEETHIWEIRYATSGDGINWTPECTVLQPGLYDGLRLTQVLLPCVIADDDGLKMWLTVRESVSKKYRVAQCSSTDGIAWSDPQIALELGTPGEADDGATTSCSILKENGIYRMWYGGYALTDRKMRTLYAESTDGATWERRGVCLDTGDEGSPDAQRAYRPHVRRIGDGYLMLYTGINDGTLRGPYVIMLATSDDGLSWERQGVLIDAGEPGTPDELRAYDPCLLPSDGGGYDLWYIGKAADGVRRICHAKVAITAQ